MQPDGQQSHSDAIRDVIVIGAGPAGSCAASLLASLGRDVLIVEREELPRYHVGESLLPGIAPLLSAIGAREAVAKEGFELKTGQTFRWGGGELWDLRFSELDGVADDALFVERARFDEILAEHAVNQGATLLTGRRVVDVVDPVAGLVRVTLADGTTLRCHQLIDASGQGAFLASRRRLRTFSPTLPGVAVWAYYGNVGRLEGHRRRHILTVAVEQGWLWVIPLRNGRTSVGLVTTKAHLSGAWSPAALLDRVARQDPDAGPLMVDAAQLEAPRVAQEWSYTVRQRHGPGWWIVGDAGGFIDPLLSTGVQLALATGYLAGLLVHNVLARPADARALGRFFESHWATSFTAHDRVVQAFYSVAAGAHEGPNALWRPAPPRFIPVATGYGAVAALCARPDELLGDGVLGFAALDGTRLEFRRRGDVVEAIPAGPCQTEPVWSARVGRLDISVHPAQGDEAPAYARTELWVLRYSGGGDTLEASQLGALERLQQAIGEAPDAATLLARIEASPLPGLQEPAEAWASLTVEIAHADHGAVFVFVDPLEASEPAWRVSRWFRLGYGPGVLADGRDPLSLVDHRAALEWAAQQVISAESDGVNTLDVLAAGEWFANPPAGWSVVRRELGRSTYGTRLMPG